MKSWNRRTAIWAGFSSLLVTAICLSAGAEQKPADRAEAERIAGLIKQLGADEFSAREAATEQLTKAGLPAFKPLEEAVESPDREIRYRAARILGTIRELDLQRRLEAFLQGKDDDYELPGWGRFKKSYGDESSARSLFVEMQRADAEMLATLDRSPREAADLVNLRVQQQQQAIVIQQQSSPPPFGQIMTLLFVAAEPDVSLPAQSTAMIFNLCHQVSMQNALRPESKGGIPRKILGGLIERSEDWAAYQAMMLANQHNMKEGLTPALKILQNENNRVPHMAQYALLSVAKMGDKSHLPIIEKLFNDDGVLSKMQENNKVVHEVQVRDAALAAAVFLTKQDVKKYFPEVGKSQATDPQQLFFNARVIGFANDEDRAAAFKKWKESTAERKPVSAKDEAKQS